MDIVKACNVGYGLSDLFFFFRIFKIKCLCFVDIVLDAEAIFHLL